MSVRSKYEAELALVFGKLTKMCRETELSIEKSVQALKTRDKKLAREVMDNDKNIDAAERDIEQDCLKILLMEHPVASDFRDISAALKMITDLERIAVGYRRNITAFSGRKFHKRARTYRTDVEIRGIHGERRRAKLHQPRRQSRKRTRQTRR